MRRRTIVALVVILVAVGGLALAGLVADRQERVTITPLWTSDTAREVGGNHHVPAAGRIGEQGMVYAPISGRAGSPNCALVALAGTTGSTEWTAPIPPPNCTVHSVADPTLADYDGDGVEEVIVATTEQRVAAYDPRSGDREFHYNLTSYGYTKPVVADLVGDGDPELIVVDVAGTVVVLRPDGTAVWTTRLDSFTWGQPAVADIDGDGEPELAIGLGGSGELVAFEADGTRVWEAPSTFDSSITWMTTAQATQDAAVDIVVATARGGLVSLVDGRTGERVWTRDLGRYAAVHSVGDGDGDGDPEVYAVARDAVLRSLDADTGEIEWTTTLTTGDVQMTPPPVLGDLDGDGTPELLAVTNDGIVSVVDPRTGDVLGSHERDRTMYATPRLADIDGDGDLEAFVIYDRGQVVAFDIE